MESRGLAESPSTMIPSTRRDSKARRWCCSRIASPRASHRNTDMLPAPKASSAPIRMGMENRPSRSLVMSPTVPVRPAKSPCASVFGEKWSCSAARWTRWRVSSRTCSRPLSAFEAVAIETPASAAMSLRVAGRCGVATAASSSVIRP